MDTLPNRSSDGLKKSHSGLTAVKNRGRRPRGGRFIILSVVAIVVIVAGAVGGLLLFNTMSNSSVDATKYQAVFLTNGQVYFGKIQNPGADYVELNDVFYLEAKENTSIQSAGNSSESDLRLIKLGNEIHGPEDQMLINRDQIIFFENLESDGTVSSSISQFKES